MSESEQPPSTAPDAATGPSPSQSAPVEAIISPPPPTTVAEPSSSVAASSSSAAESVDKSAVVSEQAAAVEPIAASVADASNVENASPAVVPAACPEPASEPQQAEPSLTSELSSEVEASPAPASSPPVENLLVDSPVTVASAPDQSESSPQEEAMESKAASSPPADAAAVAAEPVPVAVAEALPAAEASPSAPAASLAPAPAPSKRSPSPSPPPSSSPPAAAAAPSASPPPSSSNSFFRSIMTAFASLKESSSRSKDSENKDPAQASPAAAAAASSPQPPLVPGQPTAAQLALCSQAESALAWGVQQDVIHSALSPSVRSVADFSALQMAETEAVQRWIVEMRTAVEWSIPEHHALLERLWASYACVLQPPSNTGAAQSPLSMRAPPFPGPISQSWKLLGFQGTNPTTDFRGVGLLSLQVLVYLGEHHRELVHVLMSLQNADLLQPREYPLACAGINLVCAVINMLEMDAPAASSASRNNNSNATSASVSSLSSSGSNFSANPANNSVAPGLHNGAGSRSAAKAELQGPAGKFLNQLSATVSEVTRKIKDKLEDAASSDSAATATQASSAASTAADAEATAAAAAAVAAAGCSVRLDPLEDQLNGLLARLGKNRLFRLFVRNKSQIPAPLTEEEAAAAALVSPSVRRAAAAGRSPQPAVPAVPFRPASGEQLAAIHSIGELLAVLFPLLDDLWVDENANYFDFNRILRSLMTHVGNVLERNPGSFAELSAELKKDISAVRQRRREMQVAARRQMGATAPAPGSQQRQHRSPPTLPIAQPVVAHPAAASAAAAAPATPTSPIVDASASPDASAASAASLPAAPAAAAPAAAASDEPPVPSAPPAEDNTDAPPSAAAPSASAAAAPRPATLKSMAAGHALSFR